MSECTLLERFEARVEATPDAAATVHVQGRRRVTTTWAAWRRRSRLLAVGLMHMGLKPGDRVAMLSQTRVEWGWFDLAVMMAGGVTVPIFPTETPSGCADLIDDSGARFAFVDRPEQAGKLVLVRHSIPAVEHVFYCDAVVEGQDGGLLGIGDVLAEDDSGRFMSLEKLGEHGEAHLAEHRDALDARRAAVTPADIATITYTPGTEGRPKGVLQTHGNFTFTSRAVCEVLGLTAEDRQLLYLPLAQIFARTSLACAVHAGVCTVYPPDPRRLLEAAREFQPTFICAVPRFFEKTKKRWEHEILTGDLFAGLVTRWAERADGEEVRWVSGVRKWLSERVLSRRMRGLFGGQVRFLISGGAPLAVSVGQFFSDHGIEIVEGYGMTETCAATHLNRPGASRLGAVGPPLAVLDADGWLHTGDLGRVDEAGSLVITGRKRDVIVTSYGKAIDPQHISIKLCEAPLVQDVLIHGDKRPFLSALVSLDREALERFASDQGLVGDFEALSRAPETYAAIERVVADANRELPSHENIRKFAILATELTAEGGGLTGTRSLRRGRLSTRFKTLLDSFYSESF
jgi:long-chain acyl-CoA synthetase